MRRRAFLLAGLVLPAIAAPASLRHALIAGATADPSSDKPSDKAPFEAGRVRALAREPEPATRELLERVVESTQGSDRLIEPLSQRELLVLAEVEKGSTVAGIAAALFISPNTVKTHLRRLYRKLGVATRSDAIRKAKSLGLGR